MLSAESQIRPDDYAGKKNWCRVRDQASGRLVLRGWFGEDSIQNRHLRALTYLVSRRRLRQRLCGSNPYVHSRVQDQTEAPAARDVLHDRFEQLARQGDATRFLAHVRCCFFELKANINTFASLWQTLVSRSPRLLATVNNMICPMTLSWTSRPCRAVLMTDRQIARYVTVVPGIAMCLRTTSFRCPQLSCFGFQPSVRWRRRVLFQLPFTDQSSAFLAFLAGTFEAASMMMVRSAQNQPVAARVLVDVDLHFYFGRVASEVSCSEAWPARRHFEGGAVFGFRFCTRFFVLNPLGVVRCSFCGSPANLPESELGGRSGFIPLPPQSLLAYLYWSSRLAAAKL